MAFLHVVVGEEARTAMDFQRHYRSDYPHVVEPDRSFEKNHNTDGWPFYLIADGEGNVLFGKTTLVAQEDGIRGILDGVAPGKPFDSIEYAGTRYAAATARNNGLPERRSEIFPQLAADGDGNVFLSYVTVAKDKSSVRLRRLDGDGKALGDDLLVSEGCADAYDAALASDPAGGVWIVYTGLGDSGRYDIFARRCDGEGALSEPTRITDSRDDAMHPAAAVDAEGRLWVAYFNWVRMGEISRDKEVFARVLDGDAWSSEKRLSPADVPDYEDHTDPAVAPDPGGGVSVAWSWDMHSMRDPKYKRYQTEYHAESPTIFGRRVSAEGGEGDLLFLGAAGIDAAPELHRASDGRLWCAWNTLEFFGPGPSKSLQASVSGAGEADRAQQYILERGARDISTPRFFEHDGLNMIWASQDREGAWTLEASAFDDDGWSVPVTLETEGNPRFPAVAVAADGRVWIAFAREGAGGSTIVCRDLGL